MPIRFATIGLDHDHIYGMTDQLLGAGAELVAFHATHDAQAARYGAQYGDGKRVTDPRAILENASVQCVLTAAVNADRADIGLAAMRHGKDVLSDKPGVVTFEQLAALRAAHAETGRRYIVHFSERLTQPSAVEAERLIAAGAIGRVINTVGLGPHRLRPAGRPAWFFQRARAGGVLADIAAHQFDQFLAYTGAASAEVVSATAANRANPDYPELQDFGEALLRSDGATGYVRVDWFTPEGLSTWGDGRNVILGTEGTIELRKYVDIGGRPGGHHLFLIDGATTRHIDCASIPVPFGARFVADIEARSETAMTQAHCFAACGLALTAQAMADASR